MLGKIWHLGVRKNCFFCLARACMAFRITKHGGGMLRCCTCGSTAFIHGEGYRGPEKLHGPMTAAMRENNDAAAVALLEIGVRQAAEEDKDAPTVGG